MPFHLSLFRHLRQPLLPPTTATPFPSVLRSLCLPLILKYLVYKYRFTGRFSRFVVAEGGGATCRE
ncbi:hypothetical protein Hanom_Chr12g01090711 [Helianthus anomalus]